jgi:toxin CcdB
MSQFQVYRNPRASRARVPFLLDVQSDVVNIDSRLVVPLVYQREFGARLPRLNPSFKVAGAAVVMSTGDIAGVPSRDLRDWIADFGPKRVEVLAAIDFLLMGF